jgi:nucleoside-diphosphate-sugar epimerase
MRQRDNGEDMTIVGDGEQRRDFTHVSDIVEANVLAGDLSNKEIVGELFNIGTGENFSILQIKDFVGGEYVHMSPRKGEARITLASNKKAKSLLKWQPKVKLTEWIKDK